MLGSVNEELKARLESVDTSAEIFRRITLAMNKDWWRSEVLNRKGFYRDWQALNAANFPTIAAFAKEFRKQLRIMRSSGFASVQSEEEVVFHLITCLKPRMPNFARELRTGLMLAVITVEDILLDAVQLEESCRDPRNL